MVFRGVKRLVGQRIVVSVIFLSILIWTLSLWIPYVVRHTLEHEVKRLTGRTFEVGEVHFNPLTMRLVVDQLTVLEPDGHAEFASFRQVVIGVSLSSVWHRRPVVREILLSQPTVNIVRLSKERYNFSDLLDLFNSSKSTGSGVVYEVRSIQVTKGAIHYRDDVLHEQHDITQLECIIPWLSNAVDEEATPVQPFLVARIDGTPVELNAQAYPFERSPPVILHVQIPQLDLSGLLARLPVRTPLHLDSGLLSMNTTLQWDKGVVKVSGTVHLDHLRGSWYQQSFETAQMTGQLTDFVYQVPKKVGQIGHLKLDFIDFGWHRKSDVKSVTEDFVQSGEVSLETALNWSGNHVNVVAGSLRSPQLKGVVRGQQFNQTGTAVLVHDLQYDWESHEGKVARFALNMPAGEWFDQTLQLRLTQGQVQWRNLSWNLLNKNASLGDFYWKSARVEGAEVKNHIHFVGLGLEGDLTHGSLMNWFERERSDGTMQVGATHWHIEHGLFQDQAGSKKNDFMIDQGDWQLSELVLKHGNGGLADINLHRMGLTLQQVTIKDGALKYPIQTQLTQAKLDISSSPSTQTQLIFLLKGIFDQKSPVTVQGIYDRRIHQVQLSANLKQMELTPLQAYFLRPYGLRMHSGKVSLLLNGRVWQEKTGLWQEQLSTQIQLTHWDVWSLDEQYLFAKWKTLFLGGVKVDTAEQSLLVDQVSLNEYRVAGVLEPTGRLNWANLVPASHKTASPWQFAVKKISLEQGAVNFHDYYIKPNYHVQIEHLSGVVSNLSSDQQKLAVLDLRGKIGEAPFQMTGNAKPFSTLLWLNLDAQALGLDLVSLSPLIGQYLGYQIAEGKLSAYVNYHVENGRLFAKNHLILNQLELGAPIPGQTAGDLPILTAVDLLKNRQGVIDVNLPVQGSLDDPQFSVSNIVWMLLKQTITQSLEEPFHLLADFFDPGSKPSWMVFGPGSYALSDSNITQLQHLAEALRVHSRLRVAIEGQAGGAGDEDGIKLAKLNEQVALWMARHPSRSQNQALQALYQTSSIPKPKNIWGLDISLTPDEERKLLLANESVSREDYQSLADKRARSTQDWLIKSGKIDASRVFLEQGVQPPKQNLEGGLARVDFSIN